MVRGSPKCMYKDIILAHLVVSMMLITDLLFQIYLSSTASSRMIQVSSISGSRQEVLLVATVLSMYSVVFQHDEVEILK